MVAASTTLPLLYQIAANPDKQEVLYNEIKNIMGKDEKVGTDIVMQRVKNSVGDFSKRSDLCNYNDSLFIFLHLHFE